MRRQVVWLKLSFPSLLTTVVGRAQVVNSPKPEEAELHKQVRGRGMYRRVSICIYIYIYAHYSFI